jgi:hypothetical protein
MNGILDQPGAFNSGTLGAVAQPGAHRSGSLGFVQPGAYQSGSLGMAQPGAFRSGSLGMAQPGSYNSGSLGCGCGPKPMSGLGSTVRMLPRPMSGLGALPISLDFAVGAGAMFIGLYLLDKKFSLAM